MLGDSVELKTLTEEKVVLKIPAGTQPGERLRVRSHGLPRADGYGRGNLVVQVQIEVPKKISDEQRSLLEQFDELHSGGKHKPGERKKGIFEKVRDMFH